MKGVIMAAAAAAAIVGGAEGQEGEAADALPEPIYAFRSDGRPANFFAMAEDAIGPSGEPVNEDPVCETYLDALRQPLAPKNAQFRYALLQTPYEKKQIKVLFTHHKNGPVTEESNTLVADLNHDGFLEGVGGYSLVDDLSPISAFGIRSIYFFRLPGVPWGKEDDYPPIMFSYASIDRMEGNKLLELAPEGGLLLPDLFDGQDFPTR